MSVQDRRRKYPRELPYPGAPTRPLQFSRLWLRRLRVLAKVRSIRAWHLLGLMALTPLAGFVLMASNASVRTAPAHDEELAGPSQSLNSLAATPVRASFLGVESKLVSLDLACRERCALPALRLRVAITAIDESRREVEAQAFISSGVREGWALFYEPPSRSPARKPQLVQVSGRPLRDLPKPISGGHALLVLQAINGDPGVSVRSKVPLAPLLTASIGEQSVHVTLPLHASAGSFPFDSYALKVERIYLSLPPRVRYSDDLVATTRGFAPPSATSSDCNRPLAPLICEHRALLPSRLGQARRAQLYPAEGSVERTVALQRFGHFSEAMADWQFSSRASEGLNLLARRATGSVLFTVLVAGVPLLFVFASFVLLFRNGPAGRQALTLEAAIGMLALLPLRQVLVPEDLPRVVLLDYYFGAVVGSLSLVVLAGLLKPPGPTP